MENFTGHPSLVTLNLSTNRLKTLQGLCHCPKLKTVNVSGNKISEFGNMCDLPALEVLDLGANAIKVLPEKLPELPNLGQLIIKDNVIAKFVELLKLG